MSEKMLHSPLAALLYNFRNASKTEREKGTYFEELIQTYFRNEPYYKDYYSDVWMYSDWAKLEGWGIETENNPKYPLELFQRVITVSLETIKIVKGLRELEV
ncbi:MAG: hypothetical protein MUF77_04925 [Leptospira sp.]|jgi:predicted helicase|nr:hypothetical protein [Leptospira sp.]